LSTLRYRLCWARGYGQMTFATVRSLLRAVGLAVLATLIAAVPAGATDATRPSPPNRSAGLYLSLGDSIAFGFQERLLDEQLETGNLDPTAFHGFTDELTRKLAWIHRGVQQVNLGCPGESTVSFRNACEYPFDLHVDYSGSSQLAAALATIRSHPGAPTTITIALGANDLTQLLDSCEGDTTCVSRGVPNVLRVVRWNLLLTVNALRRAAPRAVIVLFEYYNPFAASDPASTPNLLALDASIGWVAGITHSRVANAFPRFNLARPQPQTLCRLTLFCDEEDVHPTDAGYHEIANLMFNAVTQGPWR
jgi:lysophospholipase L1-like esterase